VILGNTPNTRLSADAGKLIVSGVIDDGVNTLPLIVRNNTGTTVLTAANTYGGETLVYNGVLQIDGGDDRVPVGSVLRLGINSFVSGTFDLNGRNQTVAGLAVNGNDNLNSQLVTNTNTGSPSVLTVDNAANFSFAGRLTNAAGASLSLVKSGPGTLTLTNNNDYAGSTLVSAGRLLVNGSITSGVTVQSDATLGGTGSTGAVEVQSGGHLAPGTSPETLSMPSLTLAGGSNFDVEIFGTSPGNGTTGYDQAIVTAGPVDVTGASLNLFFNNGLYVPALGHTYAIIDNQSAGDAVGTFAGLPADGSIFEQGGFRFSISYHGGDGNDVVLTALAPAKVYVSPTFTTANAAVDGDLEAAGTQPATVGYNAFAAVQTALDALDTTTPSTVVVNQGSYGETITLPARAVALQFVQGDSAIAALTGDANDTLALGGFDVGHTVPHTLTLGSGDLAGVISGSGGLTKNTAGTLTLSGANTYQGATAVQGGVLNIRHNTALGDTAAGTSVTDGAALQLQGDITVSDELLTIAGHGISNTGALRNVSGTNTWAGAVTLLSGVQSRIGSDSGKLTVTDNIASPGGNTLVLSGSGIGEVSGSIGGVFQLAKAGNGTWILSGANTYTTATNVNAGILNICHPLALGTTDAGTTVANNARLELAGGITVTGESLTISGSGGNNIGALQSQSGANTWAGDILLAADGTRVGANGAGQTLTVSGVIDDGPSTFTFAVRNADGGGATVLSGANTYGGNTDVVVGLVKLDGGDDRLPTGSVLRIGNTSNVASATFDLNGLNQTVSGLVSLGTSMVMTVTNSSTTASTLTVNNAAASTYAGVVSGNLALTKSAAGTLALSGTNANSHTGLTTVSGGVLALNKTAAVDAVGGNLAVSGGTLQWSQNHQVPDTNTITQSGGTVNFNGKAERIATFTKSSGDTNTGGAGQTITISGTTTVSGGAVFNINSPSTWATNALTHTGGALTVGGGGGVLDIGAGGLSMAGTTINLNAGTSGATLRLGGNVTANASGTTANIAFAGGTPNNARVDLLGGTRAFTVANGGADPDLAVSATIANGGLIKSGSGRMMFNGANTYDGTTAVSAGQLNVRHAQALGSTAGETTVADGAQLELQGGITVSGETVTINCTLGEMFQSRN